MKKYIFLITLSLLLLTLSNINAIETLGTYQKDSSINLIQQCVNSTYANITRIVYPNSTFAMDTNTVMTRNVNDYNYTYSSTSLLGQYLVYGICDENNKKVDWQYDFYITNSGYGLTIEQSILYCLFMFVLIFAFIISTILAIKIDFKKRGNDNQVIGLNDFRYMKIFFMVLSYFILLFILGITKSIMINFMFLTEFAGVLNWLYWLMFAFIFPIIVVAILFGTITFLEGKKIQKLIERGLKAR